MQINNLIFEGGGVKGIAYAGAIQVLEAQGVLQKSQHVAGTSAGAITATLVALNYNATEIYDIIMHMDFRRFEDCFNPFRLITDYGFYKGAVFKKWIEEKIIKAGLPKDATFEMMSNNPKFKSLKVFATDLNTKNIQEFSSEVTPNVIISEAVRASMSIPLFFRAWRFSNRQPNDHIFVDGGVLFNYPFDVYDNLDESLGFYLSSFNVDNKTTKFGFWSPVLYVRSLFDTLLQAQNVAIHKNRNEEKHTVMINDLNISATDFKISNKMKKKLIRQGKIATERYLGISLLS